MDLLSLSFFLKAALLVAGLLYLLSGINIVNEWERRPVLRFGKYVRTLGPGLSWTEPFTNRRLEDIAVNDEVWDLEIENVQTKDNIPITFNLVLTSRVDEQHVKKYVVAVSDGDEAVDRRTLACASQVVSASNWDEILHHRDRIYGQMQQLLTDRISVWGMKIIAVEITDLRITDSSIEQAISLKAKATKEAEAEIARAEAQVAVAEALKKAGEIYNEETRWLKGNETLLELCRSGSNNTILVPTDLVESLARVAEKVRR